MNNSPNIVDERITRALALAERIARNVIPDLRGVPLYLVQPGAGSLVTPKLVAGFRGLYRRGLDLTLRSMLEEEGRWNGPGVCVVVDAFMCFAVSAHDDDGLREVVGVTLHELAHWLDMPGVAEYPSDDYSYPQFVACCEERSSVACASPEYPPFFLAHGEEFIRLAAHLWYRAGHGGGMHLQPRSLAFGNSYPGLECLPSPLEIIDSLRDELELFDDFPLRRVAALPQPAEFTALWNRTLAKMFLPAPSAA